MKKTYSLFTALLFFFFSSSQDAEKKLKDQLIELAKIYHGFSFVNTPTNSTINRFDAIDITELKPSVEFISESIKSNNNIATGKYLTKPDLLTLEYLFIIRVINWNLFESDPVDNYRLIDSLKKSDLNKYELLSSYYEMMFSSVGNKNRPFDMSKTNFELSTLGLEDESEKGIFFLQSMNTFGAMIWGYMNIVKPPNYKLALEYIRKFPSYNGQPYYQFSELNFKDFDLIVDKQKPKSSFKKFYINKYLNTLLYHTACLAEKKKDKEEQQKVMLGSIMHNESYYKYSETPEVFRSIFQKISD
jgi:hypothetical protein